MKTVTLAELEQMLTNYQPKQYTDCWGGVYTSGLFVRWSATPEADCDRGHSRNWAAGQAEGGISCCELMASQTWHGLDTGITLAERVLEYRFLPGRPWVIEGYRPENPAAFRGSDNEPLLTDATPVAWIATC
jgi:hypothetical protein